MIAHLATFTWRDDADRAALSGLADELRAMAETIPSIRHYHCGENLGLRPGGADFGVIALVDDRPGLDAYLDSPAHVELVGRSIAPFLGTRQAVQLELTDEWVATLAGLVAR